MRSKTCTVFFNTYKRRSGSRRSFQPNRKIFKHKNFFIYFYFLETILACLDPDQDPLTYFGSETLHRITDCCFMPPESRCCELADVRARLKQEEEERLALQAEERRRQEEVWHRHQQDRERRQASRSGAPFCFRIRSTFGFPFLN